MTDYVKQESDRPDFERELQYPDGRPVDLRDATAVHVQIWVDLTKVVDQPATIEAPSFGIVSYDIQRADLDVAGDALVEFRVEWGDGDHQWFPTDERGFELSIVPPPGPRGGQPATGDGILRVADGETYDVTGTETYDRVVNAGTIRTSPSDILRT